MAVNSKKLLCGVDFGTTNSTIAIVRNGKPLALEIDEKNSNPKILKSLLYLNPKNERAIGKEAINRYLWDIKNIPSQRPRLVYTGRKIKTFGPSTASGAGPPIWVPEIVEVDDSGRGRLLQSLKSVLTSETFTGTEIFGEFYTLEDLLTVLLSEIKARAERIAGGEFESIVLGRPVRYVGNGKEKLALERMEKVAKNCGFKNVEFEYEPVGAALNFGIDIDKKSTILVFDFGGGTLDVCIMTFPEKRVAAVSGRPIGGDLLDSIIVEKKLAKYFGSRVIISGRLPMSRYFLSALKNWYEISLLKNVKSLEALDDLIMRSDDRTVLRNLRSLIVNDYGYEFYRQVDRTKIALSSAKEADFRFECKDFTIEEKVKRKEFEEMIENELMETKKCLGEALAEAGLKVSNIDKVLMTGGSSKIPVFIDLLNKKFGEEKVKLGDRFLSVALGLSIKAEKVFR